MASITIHHTFMVMYTQPKYDESTDGITGYVTRIDDAFATYVEAYDYASEQSWEAHASGDDETHYFIKASVDYDIDGIAYGRDFDMDELIPSTGYYGPNDNLPF